MVLVGRSGGRRCSAVAVSDVEAVRLLAVTATPYCI